MGKILFRKDASLAMFFFLENYYRRTKADEIGLLLTECA